MGKCLLGAITKAMLFGFAVYSTNNNMETVKKISSTESLVKPNLTELAELTNYELWQIEKYGNILRTLHTLPDGSCENNEDEIRRQAEWVERQSDNEMHKLEY